MSDTPKRRDFTPHQGHRHNFQPHGLTYRTRELDGGFVRERQTIAVQTCSCGQVREIVTHRERWRPYA